MRVPIGTLVAALTVGVAPQPATAWQSDVRERGGYQAARALLVDGANDVLIAGSPGTSVAKFSGAQGTKLWTRRLSDGCCSRKDVALTPGGDVVVAGSTYGAVPGPGGPDFRFTIAKLTGSSGAVVWRRDIPSGSGDTVAVDGNDDVFAGGRIEGAGGGEFAVVKLAGDSGATRWTVLIGGSAGLDEGASGLAVAANGDVIAVGLVLNTSTDRDLFAVRLDGNSGAEVWRVTMDGSAGTPDFETAHVAEVDAAGDVYVAGTLQNAGAGRDLVVLKLAGASGAELWRHEVNGTANRDDEARAIALDAAGDVLVAGEVENATRKDYTVIKLASASGSELWRREFNGWSSDDDRATDVAVDATGDVLAVGEIWNEGTQQDVAVMKLAGLTGAELWRRDFNGRAGPSAYDGASNVAPDGNRVLVDLEGNVVAASVFNQSLRPVYDVSVIKLGGTGGEDLVAGRRLIISDTAGAPQRRRLLLAAKDGIGVSPSRLDDPRLDGAVLEIRNPATGELASMPLPRQNWTGLGHPPGQRGYRYRDASGVGACRSATIIPGRGMKISCRGSLIGFSLDEASQGSLAARLTTGLGAHARRYCMHFGGTVVEDSSAALGSGTFRADEAPAPATCPFP